MAINSFSDTQTHARMHTHTRHRHSGGLRCVWWLVLRVSERKPSQDIWDSCCLSRGFQSVRIPCYTSNTSSVCLVHTYPHMLTYTHTRTHIRSIQTRTITLRCSMWSQELFLSVSLHTSLSPPPITFTLPSLPFPWPVSSILSSNSRPWCIVSPSLVSLTPSLPCCVFLCSPAPPPPTPHRACETIGRCNI